MNQDKAMRIAVATKDGTQIDLHFGHADGFQIYEAVNGQVRFLEIRTAEHYCQGGYGDENKRDAILQLLADCAALFVARIGDGPRQRLMAIGVATVDDYPYGEISASLEAWLEKGPG